VDTFRAQPFGHLVGLTVMTKTAMRLLTRWAGPVALLAVVLTGCRDQAPSNSDQTSATSAPTSTHTSTPTLTPTASPSAAGIPDDLPLTQGLIADGDTTVTTPQRGVRGIDLQPMCWGGTWPGAAVDRLVVEQVGPELGVTRELAVYRDPAAAAAVAKQVRVDAAHCHRLPATSERGAMDVTLHGDDDTGVAAVAASFSETLTGGQPGGAVFVFTRVGRAVLAVEDSGEWTRESAVDGARHLERADRDLVARLGVFDDAGC
jgi:hypothetical protein